MHQCDPSRGVPHQGLRGWSIRGIDGTPFTARLTVTSSLGTQDLVRPVCVAGFAVTPSSARVSAGQTLTVSIVSVEPLSTRPVVTFTQPGRAGVSITATRRADGSYRAAFKVASGSAGTASIKVSAKDTGGHVNTTTVPVAIGAR